MLTYILGGAVSVLILVLDQIVKSVTVANIALGDKVDFIPWVLGFSYVQNLGGGFGFMSDNHVFLMVVRVIAMAAIIVYCVVKKPKDKLLVWSLFLVMTGGLGNLIDNIFRAGGKVVDTFDFTLFDRLREIYPDVGLFRYDFPVFNVADCCICVGAGLLVLYLIVSTVRETKGKKNEKPENDSENG